MAQNATSLAVASVLLFSSSAAMAANLPTRVGQCVQTRIAFLGSRLKGTPGSGSLVQYEDGGAGVSYEIAPQVMRSRVGDRVKLCLVSIPKDCPPGDDQGRQYMAINLRTHGSWVLPNSEHMCGGA
jgi:hypothetical protein